MEYTLITENSMFFENNNSIWYQLRPAELKREKYHMYCLSLVSYIIAYDYGNPIFSENSIHWY